MKNRYLCSFTLSFLVASAAHGAIVRIKNATNQPIWARINQQTREVPDEEDISRTRGERILSDIATVGAFELVLLIWDIEGHFTKYAHFKKISPGKSRYFNSGFERITKITFASQRLLSKESWVMPKGKTFIIKTDIAPLTVGARVEYTGWNKAKRVR